MALEKTWRWFGEKDPIKLEQLAQIGVEGVITALHHIPNGEVWPKDEILKVKEAIESHGMRWSVVESLPVSEGIKIRSDDRPRLIANYQQSVRNLGECGIDTICYNFMPVLDWARTDLHYKLPNGAESMYFDFPTFVAFDVFILKRPGAEADYPLELVDKARTVFNKMTEEEAEELAYNIIVVTQGFIDGVIDGSVPDPKALFLEFIDRYKDINKAKLRENLKAFLDDVIPVAEEAGVRLAIHPDDPPFPVLGLPRIIGQLDDYEWLFKANSSPNNGITFCAGSLSARRENNLAEIIEKTRERIHFVHLRNTQMLEDGSFYESGHLTGTQNMVPLVTALLQEQKRRIKVGRDDFKMPVRPDHGLKLLDDFNHQYNPGYPLIGRLKGLAELEGIMTAIDYALSQQG
ncbi:mannonate dehydratase [Prolixibacter denitrificans]|uniref:Mannonate dehydratase n=1 Tax=Prolixibacter denitrificans TaxID=1541063 RepID=A0A2P8C647_9BACT|nr:mannonate dehydratase [Prolixibacter denitrificans]PSK80430.1 mannonate dehydratase [Prolixibacter denitrificans]GET23030.1 mannonate dehydratase [Prolixibacter denitrificans]